MYMGGGPQIHTWRLFGKLLPIPRLAQALLSPIGYWKFGPTSDGVLAGW